MNRGFDLFLEMLSPTFEAAELAGVNIEDAFPALVDFTAALTVALSGEAETDSVANRLRSRQSLEKLARFRFGPRNLR
jgi:hypothetical protein